ncbi:MAG: MBL fold metallo-hydrolase [bacterium]
MADKKKGTYVAIRILLIVIFLTPFVFRYYKSTFSKEKFLEITVFDVGQGDSILIKTPNNKKVLIDGGPEESIVGKIPQNLPFFDCNVDIIISTHSHSDHLNGLNSVLKRCTSPLFIINDIGSVKVEPKATVQIIEGFRGDKFFLDNVNFYILWPPEGFQSQDLNNLSIVVLVEYAGFKALFTGDAESGVLLSVTEKDIDFLKVSHHGSYDEDLEKLLMTLKPEIMAISVGKNSFGHPSSQVLGIADSADIEVFRTDVVGDVVIKVDVSGKVYRDNP